MKKQKSILTSEQPKQLAASDIVKYIFSRSCIYFTVVTLVILIAQVFSTGQNGRTVEPIRLLLNYPFTLALACADCIFKARSLGTGAKVAIHYAITISSFYIFVCLLAKNQANPIVIIMLISVIYFIISAPILIVRHSIKKKKKKEVPYQSVYSKAAKK